MRSRVWWLASLLAGCGVEATVPEADAPVTLAPACDAGTTTARYALDGDSLDAWPDDAWTVEDGSARTGLSVQFGVDDADWVADLPELASQLIDGLGDLDGFARVGTIILRAEAAFGTLPTTADESLAFEGLQLWAVDGGSPERLPYAVTVDEEDRQLAIQPLKTLRSGARHVLVATQALTMADGSCLAPSETFRRVLSGQAATPVEVRAAERLAADLAVLGFADGQVSHAVGFTTHSAVLDVAEAATDLRSQSLGFVEPLTCEEPDEDGVRHCQGVVQGWDYRHDGAVRPPYEPIGWELPVDAWLPPGLSGPAPVLFYGHGLNSRRTEAARVVEHVADLGVIVVTSEALEHGDHPSGAGDSGEAALRFLGLDLEAGRVDAEAMRGNFTQSAIDRLAYVLALQAAPDLDGDGVDDVDPDRMFYLGVSLGGMIGAIQLAITPEFDASMLYIAGGQLGNFVTDGDIGGFIGALLAALVGQDDEMTRVLSVIQSGVDGGDPAAFGAHVRFDRLDEAEPPHVAMPVSPFDRIVPPSAGMSLARALELPHIAPVVEPVDGLTVVEGEVFAANDRGRTAGYQQLDRIRTDDGDLEWSSHTETPLSDEGVLMLRTFLGTWMEEGTPELVEPYAVLNTPLPE